LEAQQCSNSLKLRKGISMNEEHVKYLETVYPKIFAGKYGGLAVGDGWFTLLDHMCRVIQAHCDWHSECPQVVAEQVKEKFGGLRFYYTGGDEYVAGVVSMTESIAGVTCEDCGVPGIPRSGGWIHVSCDACEEIREANKRAVTHED
jgi:hypothetical protein